MSTIEVHTIQPNSAHPADIKIKTAGSERIEFTNTQINVSSKINSTTLTLTPTLKANTVNIAKVLTANVSGTNILTAQGPITAAKVSANSFGKIVTAGPITAPIVTANTINATAANFTTLQADAIDFDGDVTVDRVTANTVVANGGVTVDNITIDGTEIDLSSGDLTLDVAGNILLNADGGGIYFQDASTLVGSIQNSSSDLVITSEVQDKDIIFKGDDGGSSITALTLDMSAAGTATFNSDISLGRYILHTGDTDTYLDFTDNQFDIFAGNVRGVTAKTTEVVINENNAAVDFRVESAGTTNMLFVDADQNKVGIGHGSPTNTLDVRTSGQVGLTLGSTDAGGAILVLDGDSNGDASGADYSYINHVTDGRLDIYQDSPSASNTNEIRFYTYGLERLRLKSTEAVFNEASYDVDFRVEGDTETHALFVQAGSNGVGIGQSSPNSFNVNADNLVVGSTSGENGITIVTGSSNSARFVFSDNSTSSNDAFVGAIEYSHSSNSMMFYNSGTQRMVIATNGDVTNSTGSYGTISDETLKENISDASSQWDDIKALQVRKYSMKADNLDSADKIGVIAQELEKSGMNGLVKETEWTDSEDILKKETVKSVKYSILYMKAIKALQEAMTRIETLEAEVKALKG